MLPPATANRQRGADSQTSYITSTHPLLTTGPKRKWLKSTNDNDDKPLDTFLFEIKEATSRIDQNQ